MSGSNYLEDAVLNHIFDKASYPAPTVHVGLSTADPGEDGSGLSEPVGGAYDRVVTAPADWNASSGGMINNAVDLTFAEATEAWGTITHFGLFDKAIASHSITGVTTGGVGSGAFIVSGDITSELEEGALLRIHGSTGNDGLYTVRAGSSYDGGADETTVNVEEAVSDSTVDGTLQTLGNLLFSGTLQSSKEIEAGDTAKFGANDLEITAD
ncbi:MAG: hypothetical protein ACLFWL_09050 [Candidatus Brocadiia bacterium]